MQQSPLNIAASLLRQLALRIHHEIPELVSFYSLFRARGTQPDLSDILKTLVSVSSLFESVYILLDALEECEKGNRGILLDMLKQMAAENVKIFTTSRSHLWNIRSFSVDVSMIEIVADTSDIKIFIEIKLDEYMLQSVALKKNIVNTLSISAKGV